MNWGSLQEIVKENMSDISETLALMSTMSQMSIEAFKTVLKGDLQKQTH